MVVAKEATTKEIHEKPPKMNVSQHYTPGDATLQPLSTNMWRCCRPKICSHIYSQWERDAQELTGHLKAHVISQNQVSTKSNDQDGHLVKREKRILPETQMEGACLDMKPPHQSLSNLVPHGIQRNP